MTNALHCSWCGKSQSAVSKMIAGPNVFICNECVVLCAAIISHDDEHFHETVAAMRAKVFDGLTEGKG